MYVVLGATGHVGREVARVLLARGEAVTAVVRDEAKGEGLRAMGAELAVADVLDSGGLRAVFKRGRRAFLLNPPADPSGDTDREEMRSIAAILEALDGSGLEKVVAQSTYGAQDGHSIGDLGTLHAFETGLRAQPIPATIQRAAYYMSNWDASLETAERDGVVHTLFPAGFRLPMVAAADLGETAAKFLTEPAMRTSLHHVEGPDRHTPADVADAFAAALGRPVKAVATPREEWRETFLRLGFSEAAAASYTGMTALAMEMTAPGPAEAERGTVSLRDYLASLITAAREERERLQ